MIKAVQELEAGVNSGLSCSKRWEADLINKGGDYSTDLRKEVKELLLNNSDSKLLAFAKAINAYNEEDEQS
jgi:hypothetical protein